MAREAWSNALNAQLAKSQVWFYFRAGLFPIYNYVGFFSVGFLPKRQINLITANFLQTVLRLNLSNVYSNGDKNKFERKLKMFAP